MKFINYYKIKEASERIREGVSLYYTKGCSCCGLSLPSPADNGTSFFRYVGYLCPDCHDWMQTGKSSRLLRKAQEYGGTDNLLDALAAAEAKQARDQSWQEDEEDIADVDADIDAESYAEGDAEAARRYRLAAEQGLAEAQNNLGWMYAEGRGVAQDDAEAVRWYRFAAVQGHAMAQAMLGMMYLDGRGVAQDDAEAVRWFRKAAEQGLAEAQDALRQLNQ